MILSDMRKSFSLWAQKKEARLLLTCLLSAFAFGLIAHTYGFVHSGFSHDSLNALFAGSTEDLWKVRLGRFLVVPYRRLIRGGMALPWFIGVLSLLYIGAAAYFVCRCFAVRSRAVAVGVTALLVINPTVTSITASYLYELDFDMLGLLAASAGAWLWVSSDGRRKRLLFSALLVTAALGLYQSYLSVTATVMVFVSIRRLLSGASFNEVLRKGLLGIAVILAGGLLYVGLSRLVCVLCGVGLEDRIRLVSAGMSPLRALAVCYYRWACFLLQYDPYCPTWYIVALSGATVCLGAALVLRRLRGLGVGHGKEIALTLVLAAVSPLAMNTAGLFTADEYHLMTYALWLFPVFLLTMTAEELETAEKKRLFALGCAVPVLLAGILFYNVRIANLSYLKKDLQLQSQLAQMTRVVADLEAREDYEMGVTPVLFRGAGPILRPMPGFEDADMITGVQNSSMIPYDFHLDYYDAYEAYFRYYLNYPLCICDGEAREDILSRWEKGPAFPEKGYIRNIDGVLAVDLG